MNDLLTQNIICPYCGEPIQVLLDMSIDDQEYIEDCQVCCRPINFYLSINYDGTTNLRVAHEDDAY